MAGAGEVTAIETVAERGPVTAAGIETAIEVVTGEPTEETEAGTEAEIAGELLPLDRVLDWATGATTAAHPTEVASVAIAEIEVEIGAGTDAAGTVESVAEEATGIIFSSMEQFNIFKF